MKLIFAGTVPKEPRSGGKFFPIYLPDWNSAFLRMIPIIFILLVMNLLRNTLFALLLTLAINPVFGQTLQQGPFPPDYTANCSTCPGVPWVNNPPNWVQFFLPPDSFSTLLYYTDFGFTVPTGSVITGVKVYYAGDFLGPQAKDTVVQLLHNNTLIGSNQSMDSMYSQVPRTYGDSLNTWGATLTPAIVNDSTFGVALRIETNAQAINGGLGLPVMTLYYQNPATGLEQQATREIIRIHYNRELHALLTNGIPENSVVSFWDIQGKCIHSPIQVSQSRIQLNEILPKGIWIVRVVNAEGEVVGNYKVDGR